MPKPQPVIKREVARFRDVTGSYWGLEERTFQQHARAPLVTYLHLSPVGPAMNKQLALQLAERLTEWATGEEDNV
jgi:hypothetical protein